MRAFKINGITVEVRREGKEIRVHLHGEAARFTAGGLGDGAVALKQAEMVIAGVKQNEMR